MAEIPLHHPPAGALKKAEAAAKNRLVHRYVVGGQGKDVVSESHDVLACVRREGVSGE